MTDKQLEKYMVEAFEYMEDPTNNVVVGGKVSGSLKAIAASFGPDVYETGLVSTLVTYSSKVNSNPEYQTMLDMIWELYKKVEGNKVPKTTSDSAMQYAIEKAGDYSASKKFKKELLRASVAIKLTLRSYPDADKKTQDDDKKKQDATAKAEG